ncbi:MAG: RIP metalloprotease RseP [Bacteroidota bacterium]|jgi:regulator of sigma E protease
MDILIRAGQLFLSLAILVTLHELGHYLAARMFKTRVEKFYLFFDPWFSIFKKKIGDTEYGIGWLPLGGYVKIAGMIDESLDKEQLKQEPQSWEFRAKPAWQRLIIMLGGIMVNLILGWLIYSMLLLAHGEEYIPVANAKYGIQVDSLAYEIGFRNGDQIISAGNMPIVKLNDVAINILIHDARDISVWREQQQVVIHVEDSMIKKILATQSLGFISERTPFVINGFGTGSVAPKAGLQKGDQILAIDSVSTYYYDEVKKALAANKGKNIALSYLRNGDTLTTTLKLPETGILGVYNKTPYDFFQTEVKSYNLLTCFPAGYHKAVNTLMNYIRQFKLIFNSETEGYKHVGGFISIGKAFSPEWDWFAFWNFTAFFSIALAFMNFLPIPALDGGHVMFTLYEMITGRKPNDKFLEYAQIVGMVLLLGLMLFANGNDIVKLFK